MPAPARARTQASRPLGRRAGPLPALAPLALLLLLAALLAGCTVQLPDAHTPEKPGLAWEEPDGDLWLARQSHCIACGTTTESATEHLTLLYRDGSVLHVVYGQGGQRQIEGYPAADGNRSGLTFAFPEHERFRAQVDAAWRAMTGTAPDLVRVHEVAAALIDPSERETVLRVVEHALRQTDDLAVAGTTGCDGDACADGARSVAFYAWGRPQESTGERTEAGPATDRDAGWRLLDRQALALQAWLGVAQTA